MNEQSISDQYKKDAANLHHFDMKGSKVVRWESPSNIALIKYWGKNGDQLPQNPSLSFNLKNSKTVTKIIYQKRESSESNIQYFFEEKQNDSFEKRVKNYFEKIAVYLPFLKALDFTIYSHNTFPHSAGIASSASSFSALAHGLCSIEQELFQSLPDTEQFHQKASFLARLGSGSASRSVSGKVVLWGKTETVTESTDEYALPIDEQVHHVFKTYRDAVLIIDSGQKASSSSTGHVLMENHPFAKARYLQANVNLEKLLLALKSGGEKLFAEIVENEAMTLHALMLSSNPSVILMKPNTFVVIEKLKEFRQKNRLNFAITLDAGPNVHILYPNKIKAKMVYFIKNELIQFCKKGKWIDDEISDGPKQISL
ncbi:MAG: diphosphomevalonate decarboxylase [Bacteroidota bacterium]|nr:diphosphomevalonate decarboxylase [Bacteroidota bacterium]